MTIIRRLDRWWERNSPKRRIDFNLGNMFMLAGLMLPSFSIVLRGPVPSSALAAMPTTLQTAMCGCIFAGCGMKLHGALAGRRFYFRRTPLKRCYRYGYTWAPLATIGTWVYAYYIIRGTQNFWSALGAISTPMFGLGISLQAVLYWLEYRRIDRNEKRLIARLTT